MAIGVGLDDGDDLAPMRKLPRPQLILLQRRQIDDEFPNGGTDTQIAPSAGAAKSERQVLDWKM